MNETWAYKKNDTNWKSAKDIIRNLIDVVGKGGNYLLNVGPDAQGKVPTQNIAILAEVGKWMKQNSTANYDITAGPFHYLSWGKCTQKGNKLFLHVFNWPSNGVLNIPLLGDISKAYKLIAPSILLKIRKYSDKSTIKLNGKPSNEFASVIVLELNDKPIVLPPPALNKISKASSEKQGTSSRYCFDTNLKNSWQPKEDYKDRWVEGAF